MAQRLIGWPGYNSFIRTVIDQCDLAAAVPPGSGQLGLVMDIIRLSLHHNMSACTHCCLWLCMCVVHVKAAHIFPFLQSLQTSRQGRREWRGGKSGWGGRRGRAETIFGLKALLIYSCFQHPLSIFNFYTLPLFLPSYPSVSSSKLC